MKSIITISRQFGSGGRTIGRKLAERLQIPCYDKELIEKIAEESGFSEEYVEELGEYAPSKGILPYAFIGRSADGLSSPDRIWIAQVKVIQKLAEEGPCIFVGRCADYLLKDKKDCLNVFIYANEDFRAGRIVNLYGETDVAPLKRLAEKDKKRSKNYKYYTQQIWGDRENYHLCIDSSALGIDTAVDIIERAFRS